MITLSTGVILEGARPLEFGVRAELMRNRVYLKYLTSKTIADFSAFAIERKIEIAPQGLEPEFLVVAARLEAAPLSKASLRVQYSTPRHGGIVNAKRTIDIY